MNKLIALTVTAAGMTFALTGCQAPPPPQPKSSQVKPPAPIPRGAKSCEKSIEFQKSKEIVIE